MRARIGAALRRLPRAGMIIAVHLALIAGGGEIVAYLFARLRLDAGYDAARAERMDFLQELAAAAARRGTTVATRYARAPRAAGKRPG